jgi:hypothetical protein
MPKKKTIQGIGPEVASEGSRLFQEEKGTETEHRLSRWIPIGAGRHPPFCYTKLSNLQEGLAKRGGNLTKTLDLCPDS